MANNERKLNIGVYRHFKGDYYAVLGTAVHSETKEPMVIYRALYDDGKVYVRPLAMFLSPVDREKYPDAGQDNRFQEWDFAEDSGSVIEPGMDVIETSGTIAGVYRHFKGKFCMVLGTAIDSETKETMVLYRLLNDGGNRVVRPMRLFNDRVDKEKYPDATQEHRFEPWMFNNLLHPTVLRSKAAQPDA